MKLRERVEKWKKKGKELGGGAEREKQNGGRETDWRDGGGRGKDTD